MRYTTLNKNKTKGQHTLMPVYQDENIHTYLEVYVCLDSFSELHAFLFISFFFQPFSYNYLGILEWCSGKSNQFWGIFPSTQL